MNKRLLLTVLGDDRHGLVESLSETIKRYKGNWLESRLCHLEGKFAGMVSLEVEGALKAHLISGLKELGNIGLNVTITDLSDPNRKRKRAVSPALTWQRQSRDHSRDFISPCKKPG